MDNVVFGAKWYVAKEGYRWHAVIESSPTDPDAVEKHWYLDVETGESGESASGRLYYNPLETTGLFREFASLDIDKESMLRFANRFGLLGHISEEPAEIAITSEFISVWGEAFSTWANYITLMKSLLNLWENRHSQDLPAIMEEVAPRLLPQLVTDEEKRLYVAHGMTPPSKNPKAYEYEIVDSHLRANVYPQEKSDIGKLAQWLVISLVNKELSSEFKLGLSWDAQAESARINVAPDSLISMLWLQFAQEIANPT